MALALLKVLTVLSMKAFAFSVQDYKYRESKTLGIIKRLENFIIKILLAVVYVNRYIVLFYVGF